jgi:hypothetical protein
MADGVTFDGTGWRKTSSSTPLKTIGVQPFDFRRYRSQVLYLNLIVFPGAM